MPDAHHLRLIRAIAGQSARRLDKSGWGRFARLNAVVLAVYFAAWVIFLRVDQGTTAPLLGLPVKAARLAVWTAALPLALAASHQRALIERREGFESLSLSLGAPVRALVAARFLAAASRAARAVAIPGVVAALVALACAPSVASVADRALVLALVAGFALLSGVVLGPLAAACELLAPLRGRSLFLVVLAASWGVADLTDRPLLSVTGALDLCLRAGLRVAGLGGIG